MTEIENLQKKITLLSLRYALLVICTILFLIPIFYQLTYDQKFILQPSLVSLFFIAFYGYLILIADILGDIIVGLLKIYIKTYPDILAHYKKYEKIYNPIFFIVLTILIILIISFFFGFDAVKEIVIALILYLLWWFWENKVNKKPINP